MTSAHVFHGRVELLTDRGPISLTDQMVERMLDLLVEADGPAAASLFNIIHDCHVQNGGVARVSSRRVG